MISLVLEKLSDETLIEHYRLGQLNAVEELIKRYKPLVRKKIRGTYYIGADKEDLLQEGMIGLFKAICDYNPQKEASFKSFATLCITRQLSTAFRTATRQKHLALNTSISLNTTLKPEDDGVTLMEVIKDDEGMNPEQLMIEEEQLSLLHKVIKASLSEFEWQVLMMYTQGRNYEEIAKETNKSVKSIDNALQRIKRKLKMKGQEDAFNSY